MKNRKLHQWLWKWHFIGGLVSLPFVLVLAVTGGIYLFQPKVEREVKQKIEYVDEVLEAPLSYQAQWQIAKKHMAKMPNAMIVPEGKKQSTEFVSGKFSHKRSVYVNPYSGKVSGTFSPQDTWMHTVRKIHGELLGGKVGTKIVELVASWMLVLILTGLYIWWPFQRGISGVFTIRLRKGKRILFRDLHAVLGFWLSGLLLLTLAGGLPWTDVFGGGFKWVQKVTNTGYPKFWNGRGLTSGQGDKILPLDSIVALAKNENLEGIVQIGLPKSDNSTFSVSNTAKDLNAQKMMHFDPYSGKKIVVYHWSDVGVLMRGRMWVMRFHQGQFGGWNWWLMFGIAILLVAMSIGAIGSYWYRKKKGKWSVPKVPESFTVQKVAVVLILVLGIVLPMFGCSVFGLFLSYQIKEAWKEFRNKRETYG